MQQSGPLSDTASTLNDADSVGDYSDFAESEGDERLAAPEHYGQTGSALHPTFHAQLNGASDGLEAVSDLVSLASTGGPAPSSGQASSGPASSAGSGTGSTDPWDKEEEGLVAVGRDLAQLRFLLTGSSTASPGWRKRLWASCILICSISGALIVVAATSEEIIGPVDRWINLGLLAGMTWPMAGWIGYECTVVIAATLPEPLSDQSLLLSAGGSGYAAGENTRKDRFMPSLLNSKVTAQCANSISRRGMVSVLQMLGPFTVFFYFATVMASTIRFPSAGRQANIAIVCFFMTWPVRFIHK